jgi:hypothetical protein
VARWSLQWHSNASTCRPHQLSPNWHVGPMSRCCVTMRLACHANGLIRVMMVWISRDIRKRLDAGVRPIGHNISLRFTRLSHKKTKIPTPPCAVSASLRHVVLRPPPRPGRALGEGGILAGPRSGAASCCQAAPPSSAIGGRNRLFHALLYVAWKKGEKRMFQAYISSVSDVSEACCKCFRWMLQK